MNTEHPADMETAAASSSRSWLNISFFLALFFSSSLVLGLFASWKTMLPIYADYELDLSHLTLAFLNPNMISTLTLLPILVLGKEFANLGPWKKRIDIAAIFLSLAIGLVAAWAIASPYITIINSLDG